MTPAARLKLISIDNAIDEVLRQGRRQVPEGCIGGVQRLQLLHSSVWEGATIIVNGVAQSFEVSS